MRLGVFLFALLFGSAFAAADDAIAPGAKLDALTVGATTYRHVQVRSVNARTAIILHDGGLSSIRLRDLSPEWQTRFGYNPAAEHAAERAIKPASVSTARTKPPPPVSAFEKLLQTFGQPATLNTEIDLRPKFFELELNVKNQGRRPSCAVFAIVSALEFQNAQLTGHAQKFSEEYLIWATRKTLTRVVPDAQQETETADDADAGFTLGEVVSALRDYGIPLQSSMPNT
jgi:hypothetical protein